MWTTIGYFFVWMKWENFFSRLNKICNILTILKRFSFSINLIVVRKFFWDPLHPKWSTCQWKETFDISKQMWLKQGLGMERAQRNMVEKIFKERHHVPIQPITILSLVFCKRSNDNKGEVVFGFKRKYEFGVHIVARKPSLWTLMSLSHAPHAMPFYYWPWGMLPLVLRHLYSI